MDNGIWRGLFNQYYVVIHWSGLSNIFVVSALAGAGVAWWWSSRTARRVLSFRPFALAIILALAALQFVMFYRMISDPEDAAFASRMMWLIYGFMAAWVTLGAWLGHALAILAIRRHRRL